MKKLLICIIFMFSIGCFNHDYCEQKNDYLLFKLMMEELYHYQEEYCIENTCCFKNIYCNVYGCWETIECY